MVTLGFDSDKKPLGWSGKIWKNIRKCWTWTIFGDDLVVHPTDRVGGLTNPGDFNGISGISPLIARVN